MIAIPNTATVLSAALLAAAHGMLLIKRRGETALSHTVPTGWVCIAVKTKGKL